MDGVYRLAKLLGRPYRRVFDHVKTLEREGLLRVTREVRTGRRQSVIEAVPVNRIAASRPPMTRTRIWSAPIDAVDDRTLIASVLAEPTFDDLLSSVLHYGLQAVRATYRRMLDAGHFEPWAQQEAARILDNIEIGFARAA